MKNQLAFDFGTTDDVRCECGIVGGTGPISLDPDHFSCARFCLTHFDRAASARSIEGLTATHFRDRAMPVELGVALVLTLHSGRKRGLECLRTVARRLIRFHAGEDMRGITPHALNDDCSRIRVEVKADAGKNKRSVNGDGAVETYISVVRRMYQVLTPYVGPEVGNPGNSLTKPGRRCKGEREVYTSAQLQEIWRAAERGTDPRLFHLMLNLVRLTAIRRSSLIGMNLEDIEWATGKTTVRGKKGAVYEVYISHQAMEALLRLYLERADVPMVDLPALMTRVARADYDRRTGVGGTPALLRRSGNRIVNRTVEQLFTDVRSHVNARMFKLPFDLHSLRHTTLSQIHENFDEAAAAGFAGHRSNKSALSEATRDYVMLRDPIKITIFNALFAPMHTTGPRTNPKGQGEAWAA